MRELILAAVAILAIFTSVMTFIWRQFGTALASLAIALGIIANVRLDGLEADLERWRK